MREYLDGDETSCWATAVSVHGERGAEVAMILVR